jgi:hypothetical protein
MGGDWVRNEAIHRQEWDPDGLDLVKVNRLVRGDNIFPVLDLKDSRE